MEEPDLFIYSSGCELFGIILHMDEMGRGEGVGWENKGNFVSSVSNDMQGEKEELCICVCYVCVRVGDCPIQNKKKYKIHK
jgi:hypothetical protein